MIVVDASVIVRILTREPGADAALSRLDADAQRLAPDWMRIEVSNALANKVIHEQLSAATASSLLASLPAYIGTMFPTLPLLDDAFALALRLQHAVYDCLYFILAERQGAILLTADKRFVEKARQHGLGGLELLP